MMELWLAQELRALAGWLRFDCADDADAKKLNPSGLRMAASAEADHLLGPLSQIRVLWSRLPGFAGFPDRFNLGSERCAGSISSAQMRATRALKLST
jgi:hypothetical protein